MMNDILTEIRKVHRLRGDTYSSAEVIGMIGRAADEIEALTIERERLRAENDSLRKMLVHDATSDMNVATVRRINEQSRQGMEERTAAAVQHIIAGFRSFSEARRELTIWEFTRAIEAHMAECGHRGFVASMGEAITAASGQSGQKAD